MVKSNLAEMIDAQGDGKSKLQAGIIDCWKSYVQFLGVKVDVKYKNMVLFLNTKL